MFAQGRVRSGYCWRWVQPRSCRTGGAGVGRGLGSESQGRLWEGIFCPWKVSAEIVACKDLISSVFLPGLELLCQSLPRKRFHYCTFYYPSWVNTLRTFLLHFILLCSTSISKIFLLSLTHKIIQFWRAGQRKDETAGMSAAQLQCNKGQGLSQGIVFWSKAPPLSLGDGGLRSVLFLKPRVC